MKKDTENIKWYDSGNIITSLIIGIILLIVVCSQSFVVVTNSPLKIFGSVINHNTTFLLVLVYFIFLKTYFGKKYFNYLNVFLLLIYSISTFTSLLTLVQSFSLNTVLSFLINIVLLIYLFHTMFRDTRLWKDYKLGNSPFNELNNDVYFNGLIILVTITLVVNLISTVVISGLIISILEAIYITLLGRYVYLYREFLDYKKINIKNKGNFDKIKKEISEDIKEVNSVIKDKTTEIIEKSNIDKISQEIKEKISTTVDKKIVKGDK